MKYEIRHRYSGAVLFSLECESLKICVQAAITAKVNLSGSDLRGSNLSYSNLSDSDLRGSNLSGSDLSGSNLRGSNLSGSDLRGSNLSYSDLRDSDLRGSNLSGSDLSGSNLSGSDLSGSNLRSSDLSGSNLRGSNLSYSNLSGSDLSGIPPLEIARRRITPEEGEFVGWKKLNNEIICKLIIPADAQRVNAIYSRKCRASKVIVAAMYSPDGDIFAGIGIGLHDGKTKYKTGKETFPDSFDDRITEECSNGIHFYITRAEAEAN